MTPPTESRGQPAPGPVPTCSPASPARRSVLSFDREQLPVGLMETGSPSIAKILTMVLFALSCVGLLLFLWLSFGGTIPFNPQGYRFGSPSRTPASSPTRPTCGSPASPSAR